MIAGPLAWGAQIAAHAAYVAAHPAVPVRVAVERERAYTRSSRRKRTTAEAEENRAALRRALQDGRPHRFGDLRAALPGLSCQGVYYLTESLGAAGEITITDTGRRRYAYQLTQGDRRHDHV